MRMEVITIPERSRCGFGFGSVIACKSVVDSLAIKYDDVKLTVCENEEDLCAVVVRNPDLVILAVKFVPLENGQKIWLSDFFEKNGIGYTGSKEVSMKYDVNKEDGKNQVRLCGVKTADFMTSVPGEYNELEGLPLAYPLFLKPSAGADSIGIDSKSLVNNFAQFNEKLESLYDMVPSPILVEQYLSGREFTVAMIEDGELLIVAAIEIVPHEVDGVRILGEKVKMEDTEFLKEVVDAKVLVQLSSLARKAFLALGARDFARIDIKMDGNGECYFMEANLTPGMNKGSSYFPEAFDINLGMNYEAVTNLIVKNALTRKLAIKRSSF